MCRHISRLDRIMDRTQRELVIVISRGVEENQRRKLANKPRHSAPKPANPPPKCPNSREYARHTGVLVTISSDLSFVHSKHLNPTHAS